MAAIDLTNHQFKQPVKVIISFQDVETFKNTSTCNEMMKFIVDLQQSVLSKKISETQNNNKFDKLIKFISLLDKYIDEIPPLQQPMRFGNKSFRTWLDKVKSEAKEQINSLLPESIQKKDMSDDKNFYACDELYQHFIESFGSYERIDYGTGHELNFIVFLYCLNKLSVFTSSDYEAAVRNVFYKYIKLMRKLQLTYMLEPAGSHGVWGLDDYHFIPFVFGAAELVESQVAPTPDAINNESIVEKYKDEYMYLNCIKFIKQVKSKAPFHETSPILYNISGSASWTKVANGLLKMFQDEVMFKHPVIKHCFFGSILSLNLKEVQEVQ